MLSVKEGDCSWKHNYKMGSLWNFSKVWFKVNNNKEIFTVINVVINVVRNRTN